MKNGLNCSKEKNPQRQRRREFQRFQDDVVYKDVKPIACGLGFMLSNDGFIEA